MESSKQNNTFFNEFWFLINGIYHSLDWVKFNKRDPSYLWCAGNIVGGRRKRLWFVVFSDFCHVNVFITILKCQHDDTELLHKRYIKLTLSYEWSQDKLPPGQKIKWIVDYLVTFLIVSAQWNSLDQCFSNFYLIGK